MQTGSQEKHVCDPAEQQKQSKADMDWLLIKHMSSDSRKAFQLFEQTDAAYQRTQRTLLRRFGYSVTQHWPHWAER